MLLRIVCTGCGRLEETTTGAELGQSHEDCRFGPGEWAPFPELSPLLLGDLAVQQLTRASLPEVLPVLLNLVAALDEAWHDKCADDADQLLMGVRDAIATRLSWGGLSYATDRA